MKAVLRKLELLTMVRKMMADSFSRFSRSSSRNLWSNSDAETMKRVPVMSVKKGRIDSNQLHSIFHVTTLFLPLCFCLGVIILEAFYRGVISALGIQCIM